MADTIAFVKGLRLPALAEMNLEAFDIHIESALDEIRSHVPTGKTGTVLSVYGLHQIAGGKKIKEVRTESDQNAGIIDRINPVLQEQVGGHSLQRYGLMTTEVSELWPEKSGLDKVVGIGVRSQWQMVGTQKQELFLRIGVNLENQPSASYVSEEVLMPLAIINDRNGEAVFEQYDRFMTNTVERMLAVGSRKRYLEPEIVNNIRRYPLPPLAYMAIQSQLQQPRVGRMNRGYHIASVKSLADYIMKLH